MYDAIIVGARCAGSTLARLLATGGARVLLVDRAVFPSDTLNGHYIQPTGVRRLRDWGLLPRILAGRTARPVWSHAYTVGDVYLKGYLTWPDGQPAMAVAPRRQRLDALLLAAAADAGADVRQGFAVDDLVWDDDRVVGIRGHQVGGAQSEERASIVIGADGVHSRVARGVNARRYAEQPAQTCVYYSHWADFPADGFEIFLAPDRYTLLFPTDDGLTCIAAGWANREFGRVKANLEAEFAAAIAAVPSVSTRLAGARRVEALRGTADLPAFARIPWGPGWALVGDAGWRLDPITGQGIGDALRDADLLATAVLVGLGGAQPLPDALADYHAARDRAGMPLYQFTCDRARLASPTPPMHHLFGALQHSQPDMDRFAGIAAGITSPSEFFAPANIGRIVGQSTARAA